MSIPHDEHPHDSADTRPLQKDPRFWVATGAVALFILILYIFFASWTASAMINVSGTPGDVETHDVHCRGLSGIGQDDWPLDDSGDRASTSVPGNETPIQAACDAERSTRLALIVILAIPTTILGVRMSPRSP